MRTKLSKVYADQLGTEVSNGLRKLARKMLHSFAQKLGKDLCMRCGKRIETYSEMSLDHCENWINQPNARELFWDLDNVELSHTICNVKESAVRKRIDPTDKKAGYARRNREWRARKKKAASE